MASWQSWFSQYRPTRRIAARNGGRRRRLLLERLEERLAPAGFSPVAHDDFGTVAVSAYGPEYDRTAAALAVIDVLANDLVAGNATYPGSVTISSEPAFGSYAVTRTLVGLDGKLMPESHLNFNTNEFPEFGFAYDDNSSPVGNGFASARSGIVAPGGAIALRVEHKATSNFSWGGPDLSDYALFIRLGVSDFSSFDPERFDYRLMGRPFETGGEQDFRIPGLTPGTPFIVWIDNTIGPGTHYLDTRLALFGPTLIYYFPNDGFRGTDVFAYTLWSDDGTKSSSAKVTVNVPNFPPEAVDDTGHTPKDTSTTIDVLANDVDPGQSFLLATVAFITNPVHGTAVFEQTENGLVVVYNPAAGFEGEDRFSYVIRDDSGAASNIAAIVLTVGNERPTANDDSLTTPHDIPVIAAVLDNDFDSDGTLEFSSLTISASPAHGTAAIEQTDNGPVIVYTPAPSFIGEDRLTYTVSDDAGANSNTATVTIEVQANIPPIAFDIQLGIAENSPTVIGSEILSGFDPDGEINFSTIDLSVAPTHGIATINGSGGFLYTPAADFVGADSFKFTVRDNEGALSNEAVFLIDVFDTSPILHDDSATTDESTSVALDVLENDEEPYSLLDPASLSITSGPSRGTARVTQTAAGPVIIYTPDRHAAASTLIVADSRDLDDGDYSSGHLSLREAVKLANADRYTETFRYAARDIAGDPTSEAIVTVVVSPNPTTITFAPRLISRGSVTLGLSLVGDTSEGNSALAITSQITITGPTGGKGITLAGPGSGGDLRLIIVAAGGDLTLQNLSLTRGATDGNGGALYVQNGATAVLSNCTLTNNFAFEKGGAIYTWGRLRLSACTIANNKSSQGGGLDVEAGTVTIGRSVLKNNSAEERGGGLFNSSSTMSVTDSQFVGNFADEGGGFFNVGAITLTRCTLSGNTADVGGGFDNAYLAGVIQPFSGSTGSVTLTASTVSNNRARQGGGFFSVGDTRATNSTIVGNQADQGGGVFGSDRTLDLGQGTAELFDGILTLIDSTVAGNHADQGGGLYVQQGSAFVTNSTFVNNKSATSGGGIFNDGMAALTSTTFAGNSAVRGGGFYNGFGLATLTSSTVSTNLGKQGAGLYNDRGLVTLISTIVAGNLKGSQASDIAGNTPLDDTGSLHNLIGVGGSGGLINGVGGNLVGINPLLSKLGRYGGPVQTFALLPGSPAIDAGIGNEADARGIATVGPKDIGAFESRGFRLIVSGGSGQQARLNSAFSKPLKVTVTPISAVEPVVGGLVTFSAPPSGASARLSATQATIGSNRTASVTAKANNIAGTYRVMATALGAATAANFALRNLGSGASNASSRIATSTPSIPTPSSAGLIGQLFVSKNSPAFAAVPSNQTTDAGAFLAIPTLPADLTEYKLNANHQLLRRLPGADWKVFERGVFSFQKAPNGDLYVLTDGHELKRLQLGYSWTTLHGGVQNFFMDSYGTLFVLDTANRMYLFWSLDRYYVLPAVPAGVPFNALDTPSDLEVAQSAGISSGHDKYAPADEHNDFQFFSPGADFPLSQELSRLLDATGSSQYYAGPENLPAREQNVRSPFNNVRIVKEKIAETLDPPRYFPGVGWAQLVHAQFKCTIYDSTIRSNGISIGEDEQQIVYISHDHLHLYVPGSSPLQTGSLRNNGTEISSTTAALSQAGAEGEAQAFSFTSRGPGSIESVPGPAVQRREDNFVQSLTMSPDGTLYQLGEGGDGWHSTGSEAGPYFLWRLPAGSLWQPIDYVYSFAVAPNNTLYILNRRHELRSLPAGATEWSTLASNVRSFNMTPDGTLFSLGAEGALRRRAPGSTTWSTLDTGVQSFAMAPQGAIYALNDRQQLKGLADQTFLLTLDTGVASFAMTKDGAVYELNGRGQLKRLTGLFEAQTLASGVRSYQVALNGNVYALTGRGVLQQLTARDHWTELAAGVRSFQIAPNGDLYLLNDQHELRRQKLGYFWQTLQTGVESFTIYSDGTVYAIDSQQVVTHYASLGPYFVLEPLLDGGPISAFDPPSDNEVFLAANFLTGTVDIQYFAPGPEFPLAREAAAMANENGLQAVINTPSHTSIHVKPTLRYNSTTLPIPDLRAISNGRIIKDLVVDQIDPPRLFPGIGLAQMHHALYRCTFYFDTPAKANQQLVIYVDHDHLHFVGLDSDGG